MASRSHPRNRTPVGSGGQVGVNQPGKFYSATGSAKPPPKTKPPSVLGQFLKTLALSAPAALLPVGVGAEAGTGAVEAGTGAAEAGGTGAAGAGATTATEAGTTAAVGSSSGAAAGGAFSKAASAINSPLDFLLLIAWLFNPRMILRAVEFLVGVALMIFGLHAALQSRGESMEGFSTSESPLTRSGLGRVATELGRASRSGQRPSRPQSAPHATRRKALRQRYQREEDLQRRRASAPRPSR